MRGLLLSFFLLLDTLTAPVQLLGYISAFMPGRTATGVMPRSTRGSCCFPLSLNVGQQCKLTVAPQICIAGHAAAEQAKSISDSR